MGCQRISSGSVFAEGVHPSGAIGLIYRQPYGNAGGLVRIDKPKVGQDPWICSCDNLDAAFFSACMDTGAGWTWRLAPSQAGSSAIYVLINVKVEQGGTRARLEQFLLINREDAKQPWLRSGHPIIGEGAPLELHLHGDTWHQYWVVIHSREGQPLPPWDPFDAASDVRIVPVAVLQQRT